ncbi:hypothetical protein [Cloacibacillus sp.]|uniref:hypothetical protein n=1 Tax=Cloacibacillus sp. TaxID=2049023 RepID=UPI0025BDCE73|nr:hypothetical protein [Cloacibacillus sp.]MCC8056452.1 cellulose biosynthesis cyclic di-GMP-binding regulatory protein BcsB [Cloacibacillus sp.]
MTIFEKIAKALAKLLKDFALIFYDDLEFRAMSLPRVAAGVLTAAVGASWIGTQFCGRRFDGFEALCGLCGGVWAAYTFKRRLMPPSDETHGERRVADDGDGSTDEDADPDKSG